MTATTRPLIVLCLNIGERHHQWVTKADLRALVDGQEPIVLNLPREFDRERATPREWRAVAHDIDQLIARARAATDGPARYIVVGRAPLPVFAYLGAGMVRMGEVTFANDLEGEWQFFGPPKTRSAESRDAFAVVPPSLGRARQGRFALSIQCSREYRNHDDSVASLMAAEGIDFLGSYEIHSVDRSHRSDPLVEAELPVLLSHVEQALDWIGTQAPNTDSLMVLLAGPAWLAFWVGHRLVPTVCGRFDLPIFIPGVGYRRALSYPMANAPWLEGRARLLLMHAEPADQTRTRASKNFDVIQDALEREHSPFEFRHRGAARIKEFMRDIELFKPDILHFHLHGATNGDLGFEDERGETERFEVDRFIAMLRATEVEPTLIVLNACFSDSLAPKLLGIAECVVAMRDKVSVDGVIEFSRLFYEALGRGNDLAKALAQGQAGAGIENVEVFPRSGLETRDIVLMPRPRKKAP